MNQPTPNVKVYAISSPDETFARAMGISTERETEIDELMDNAHDSTDTYPDAIAKLAESALNANELAYAAFHLGVFAESQRTKPEILNKLLGE